MNKIENVTDSLSHKKMKIIDLHPNKIASPMITWLVAQLVGPQQVRVPRQELLELKLALGFHRRVQHRELCDTVGKYPKNGLN